MHNRRNLIPLVIILVLIIAGSWYMLRQDQNNGNGRLKGSGTVESVDIIVASEIAGRVVEVMAEQGDTVQSGEPLFRLDDELLSAQRTQAQAAVDSAQANLNTAQAALLQAQASVNMASIQLEQAQIAAHTQEQAWRLSAWDRQTPAPFDLPAYYFGKEEEINAAQAELENAQADLETERDSFETTISDISGLEEVESRLAQAEAEYFLAEHVLDLAKKQDDPSLKDYAQASFDAAESKLEAAQTDYAELLTDEQEADVLEARAQLAVAQERYEAALDKYNLLLSGDESLQVKVAQASLEQAKANQRLVEAQIEQAQTALVQAQAQLALIDVQMSKLIIYAPVDGVILTRNIEPGEIVQPGAVALMVGQLDQLSITVYIPEDRYGEISVGKSARVAVDSFPDEVFKATVTRIADKAEFTPRNVQTDEGRRTTVFAVELQVDDPGQLLKPGMPADVEFNQ